ncbi:ScpA family protein [Isoptericola sp. b441]|uniref:Segregation and condensation protein A n=1 Tax=Actinotalea lenta TaxID=3064654 RepID=A0ABT9D9W8_9CELL|nr:MULTISPECIES: ScpA family protein [unclassified Isoptericola]MDO8107685.1 ScpA family protein [Isoptericola sp. b441]MDO8120655.1 ScpA family protein [Isoptericola sp. b490]
MPPDAGGVPVRPGPFEVHLENFSGPFDLLLGLIARHKLDITEVAIAQVTDEFIAAVRAAEESDAPWPLSQISEFLVVAATLLDLKAARLLPGEVDAGEDLELLEARDLLFARLLQYRAFKEAAADLAARYTAQSRQLPRAVSLEPHLAALLPELVLAVGPEQLAVMAAAALAPKPVPVVSLSHLHAPTVSVREQAAVLVDRLRRAGSASFRSLVADAGSTPVVVARFLGVLELFREGMVGLEQVDPLGELTVRWTGAAEGDVRVNDDYDEAVAAPAPAEEDR